MDVDTGGRETDKLATEVVDCAWKSEIKGIIFRILKLAYLCGFLYFFAFIC